jgi:hypothetical protein
VVDALQTLRGVRFTVAVTLGPNSATSPASITPEN